MELKGRTINGGDVEGEAVVLREPFSFTGDFDFNAGTLIIRDHPLFGQKIAGKILIENKALPVRLCGDPVLHLKCGRP